MKKLIKSVPGSALESLLGERVTFYCLSYIYTGKLTSVNETCVELTDASIVYETGPYDDPKWKDAQPLPKPCYVMLRCVECFMVLKN